MIRYPHSLQTGNDEELGRIVNFVGEHKPHMAEGQSVVFLLGNVRYEVTWILYDRMHTIKAYIGDSSDCIGGVSTTLNGSHTYIEVNENRRGNGIGRTFIRLKGLLHELPYSEWSGVLSRLTLLVVHGGFVPTHVIPPRAGYVSDRRSDDPLDSDHIHYLAGNIRLYREGKIGDRKFGNLYFRLRRDPVQSEEFIRKHGIKPRRN